MDVNGCDKEDADVIWTLLGGGGKNSGLDK